MSRMLFLIASGVCALAGQVRPDARQDLLRRMDADADRYGKLSRQIWDVPETGFQEEKSAALLEEELRREGFRIEKGVAGMPTAFAGSYGQGKPVIAILGEYDALPGLSQEQCRSGSLAPKDNRGTAAATICSEWLPPMPP
jgi:aminobenzoyl-glutamate utilization protein B